MKFSESLNEFLARWRNMISANWYKVRIEIRYILCHTCWCSFIIGLILLTLGVLQKTHVLANSNTSLLEGTGLFFIVIGGILIVTSPLFALYEFQTTGVIRRRHRRGNGQMAGNRNSTETTTSTTEYQNDLPIYEEIIKNDNNNRLSITSKDYPETLAVDTLNTDPFGLPDYNDIVRTSSKQLEAANDRTSMFTTNLTERQETSNEQVATISPSVQIIESGMREAATNLPQVHCSGNNYNNNNNNNIIINNIDNHSLNECH